MTTKSQEFKRQTQRAAQSSKPKEPSHKPAHRRDAKAGAAPTSTIDRNANKRAGRRGGALLEDSATGRPSRKSTRKSSDHTKRTTNQQLQAVRETVAPSARAARARARRQPSAPR